MVTSVSRDAKRCYDGASQDDLILVKLAQDSEYFELVKRDQFSMILLNKATREEMRFQIVRIIAFSVERKRHSVIVKNP